MAQDTSCSQPPSTARSPSNIQWVCTFSPSLMHDSCLILHSITPNITSVTCTRVILALRGLFLHSGTDNPPPYASGTLPPYQDSGTDRKDGGLRRRNRRNLSLDFPVSDPEGTTAQSTSAGVYELTTFGNTTFGMDVGSVAGFTGSPSSVPSTQITYGASASVHDVQRFGLVSGYYTPATTANPRDVAQKSTQRTVERAVE